MLDAEGRVGGATSNSLAPEEVKGQGNRHYHMELLSSIKHCLCLRDTADSSIPPHFSKSEFIASALARERGARWFPKLAQMSVLHSIFRRGKNRLLKNRSLIQTNKHPNNKHFIEMMNQKFMDETTRRDLRAAEVGASSCTASESTGLDRIRSWQQKLLKAHTCHGRNEQPFKSPSSTAA